MVRGLEAAWSGSKSSEPIKTVVANIPRHQFRQDLSATSASSSFSSAQQAAVPTGMGEGSRLGGGPRQMGGGDGSQMVEKGRKIRNKEEAHKKLLKARDQLEELCAFAGLSLEENFQTFRTPDNRITNAQSSSVLQGTPGLKIDQEVVEQLLSLKHFLDMLINLIESFDLAADADSMLVCLNNALQDYHRRRAEGMPASTDILNFLLAISAQVDHNKSMELYALMLKEGLQPDDTTIGCLCLSACFAGDIISIKRILLDSAGWEDQENHEDEEEDFLSSTTLYYNKFIDLCAASDSQANVQAEQTSTEQTSTEQTSTEQTSTEQTSTEQTSTEQTSTEQTSTEQVQVQLEMAWRLYHGLEADKNARPDAETFNILIGVNLKAGDHEGALRAYKLMSASGFARDLEPELWNKLIHAVAAVPSAPAYVAYGCYDALQTWGPKPDLDTYVGLMAVCARDDDAARAMALRREMEDGGVEVTGEVLRALMAMQRKAGMWEAAVETFKEMQTKAVLSTDEDAAWGREFLKEAAEKVRPNAKTLNLLIEASVEAGDHEGAVRAYKLMAANGLAHELSPVFWSKLTQFARTVIAPSTPADAANEADTPPPVLQLLSEATESGCVDPEVFNLLIETCLQAGDHEGALRAYKLMSANGLASDLDPPFWNKLILAVAAVPSAPAYVAYGCYEGMKRWGPTPDPETYQGLMAVCARDGDAARAMALKKDMQDGGVEVTAAVLHALLAMQRQAGLSEAAVKTLKEMQAKAVLSTDEQKAWGCELLTEAIEKGDAARATALRREVADGGVEVTGEVLRALMAMQRQAGMWEAAVESLKEMQAKAILLTDAGDPEGALRAYKLMSASGFARDLDPPFWNKLIHAVAAVPSAPAYVAYGCYDGMQRWGPEPDEATYQGLMAVCARDGDAARAIALRREMEDGGVEVTAVVYTALINAQGRAGEWEAAVETFKEMQGSTKGEMEHPHQPSMDTYTRLFDACFGPDGADPVIWDAMQEGKTLKFTPALQAAVSIFREAAAKGVFPPALTADPFT
ncbi:unnamed protein product, partial [Closterium sp. Naga37s-1]